MTLGRKASEILADELRRMIEDGLIRPGEKLSPIDQLAAKYRVGRSTVREALSRLKALGLVESRQGGGTYVRRSEPLEPAFMAASLLDPGAGLAQMLEVRRMLEVGAAGLAARRRTAKDVGKLGRIIAQMRDSAGSEELGLMHDANFHLVIARASGNAMLAAMVEHLSSAMLRAMRECRTLRRSGGGSGEEAGRLLNDHVKLFEAIRDGDAKRAAAAMARHMDRIASVWQQIQPEMAHGGASTGRQTSKRTAAPVRMDSSMASDRRTSASASDSG